VIDRARLTKTLNGAGFGSWSDSASELLLVELALVMISECMISEFGLDDGRGLIEARLRRFGDNSTTFLVGTA